MSSNDSEAKCRSSYVQEYECQRCKARSRRESIPMYEDRGQLPTWVIIGFVLIAVSVVLLSFGILDRPAKSETTDKEQLELQPTTRSE